MRILQRRFKNLNSPVGEWEIDLRLPLCEESGDPSDNHRSAVILQLRRCIWSLKPNNCCNVVPVSPVHCCRRFLTSSASDV